VRERLKREAAVQRVLEFLRARAENVLAAMMALMFVAFIAQVLFRYVLNLPLAWTDEVCTFVWLWGILWGASFVMRNREDIRFDMIYSHLPRRARRGLTIVGSCALVAVLLGSLPGAWSYVSFMKVEKSASLGIPLNLVYSIYLVFVLAMAIRHMGIVRDAWRDRLVEDLDTATSAGPAI
jgi:TRAP-type C4-dicarboxylate transport system permease small subunit